MNSSLGVAELLSFDWLVAGVEVHYAVSIGTPSESFLLSLFDRQRKLLLATF